MAIEKCVQKLHLRKGVREIKEITFISLKVLQENHFFK